MKAIDKDDIVKLFERHNIPYVLIADQHGFWRRIECIINERKYNINWYSNVCTLILDNDIEIFFQEMFIGTTWPNNYKTNIHFRFNDYEVCILPLEKGE